MLGWTWAKLRQARADAIWNQRTVKGRRRASRGAWRGTQRNGADGSPGNSSHPDRPANTPDGDT